MRSDMAKVLCEEPRHGARHKDRKGRKREESRTPMEEKPSKDKGNLSRRWLNDWFDHKEFGDHIQPLRKYVLAQVGRKWDDVYSEIRRTIPRTNTVNNHVYQHLFQFVATNVYIRDGVVYDGDMSSYTSKMNYPVSQDTYVHPETGVLMKTPDQKRRKRRRKEESYTWINIPNKGMSAYSLKDGIWYICKFAIIPNKVNCSGYDVLQKEEWSTREWYSDLFGNKVKRNNIITVHHHFQSYYSTSVAMYCYEKRQINKREIKRVMQLISEAKKKKLRDKA
jgi:hypothetical protein